MPVYDGACMGCGAESSLFIDSSEVDNTFICEECGEEKVRRVWRRMPGLTKASYIDSNKTARARDMQDMKDAAKLEVQKAGMRREDRAEISKEIKEKTKIK